MQPDLARFLREELGHQDDRAAGPWRISGTIWLWQGNGGAPTKGSWYFLTIDGPVAEAIRAHVTNAAAWGSVYVEATIGQTRWQTSIFPSKAVEGWLLPVKAAVRKAERIDVGSTVDLTLALAP